MGRFYLAKRGTIMYRALKKKTIKLHYNNVTGEYFCLKTFKEYTVDLQTQVATPKKTRAIKNC